MLLMLLLLLLLALLALAFVSPLVAAAATAARATGLAWNWGSDELSICWMRSRLLRLGALFVLFAVFAVFELAAVLVEPAPIELPIGAALEPRPIKELAWWARLLAIELRPPIRLFRPVLELRPRPIGA